MTKIPTVDMRAFVQTVFDIKWLAPRCLVVPCFRDPAAVALSLEERSGGWQPRRAMANAELSDRVSRAWLEYARKRPERRMPISVEDFTSDPERHIRAILGLPDDAALPHPVSTSPNPAHTADRFLPSRDMHTERRHIQSNSPVYRVTRDDWMYGVDESVLAVLHEIRRVYGTSPRFWNSY